MDPNYGQPLLYNTIGGVRYNGYEFDTASDKIVLSGSTKTDDGRNFTLMSNLVDQLEASPSFKNVDQRSFSKTKVSSDEGGKGYVANFKIDLSLEEGSFSEKDQKLSLDSINTSPPSGIKR